METKTQTQTKKKVGRPKGVKNAVQNVLRTPEAVFLFYGKKGDVFYSPEEDKYISAYASQYDIKVQTKRVLVVDPKDNTVTRITKVTILSKPLTPIEVKP